MKLPTGMFSVWDAGRRLAFTIYDLHRLLLRPTLPAQLRPVGDAGAALISPGRPEEAARPTGCCGSTLHAPAPVAGMRSLARGGSRFARTMMVQRANLARAIVFYGTCWLYVAAHVTTVWAADTPPDVARPILLALAGGVVLVSLWLVPGQGKWQRWCRISNPDVGEIPPAQP